MDDRRADDRRADDRKLSLETPCIPSVGGLCVVWCGSKKS